RVSRGFSRRESSPILFPVYLDAVEFDKERTAPVLTGGRAVRYTNARFNRWHWSTACRQREKDHERRRIRGESQSAQVLERQEQHDPGGHGDDPARPGPLDAGSRRADLEAVLRRQGGELADGEVSIQRDPRPDGARRV